MHAFICTTCGVQYEVSEQPPGFCKICEDERQYIGPSGQNFTTLNSINRQYKNIIELVAPHVYAIYSAPTFAIGQRAHLIISPGGNILWDCISNLDVSTIHLIKALGGIKAIAVSHPHFYSTIAEWSNVFDQAPVYTHAADEEWLCRKPLNLHLWNTETLQLWDDMSLIRCGGHFSGSAVLYNPNDGGSLFPGDTIQVSPDRKTVSFMYSYPNLIPLSQKKISKIREAVEPFNYQKIYGAFGNYITSRAKEAVAFSLDRYLKIFE